MTPEEWDLHYWRIYTETLCEVGDSDVAFAVTDAVVGILIGERPEERE